MTAHLLLCTGTGLGIGGIIGVILLGNKLPDDWRGWTVRVAVGLSCVAMIGAVFIGVVLPLLTSPSGH